MKRLLTTVLVLTMIATMLCVSPVVSAAVDPAMSITISRNPVTDDTVSVSLIGVSDATWVVCSIKAEATGDYIFVDEKRGNAAQSNGFEMRIASTSSTGSMTKTSLAALDSIFTVEVSVAKASGTTKLTKNFMYMTYDQTQAYIREVLAGTKSITEAQTVLS